MKTLSVSSLSLLLCTFSWIQLSIANPSIVISTNDLSFEVKSREFFTLVLSSNKNVSYPVDVHFNYTPEHHFNIEPLPETSVFHNGSLGPLSYNVTAHIAGHTIVTVKTSVKGIDTEKAFVRVGVYKISNLNLVSAIVGWLYFFCWSISFYPQIIDNWRRKSVVGLNFDFLGLNLTGFIAYSIFNIGLRFVEEVKAEYHSGHPESIIPVEVNDVVFAVHAVFATVVTIGQCFIYERGNQLISKTTVAALSLVWSTAGVFLLITSLGINKYQPWLTYLYFFSYVKLLVTLTKYIPQVFYNYKRKSTVGWSIGTVFTDFIGGLFSLMQMSMLAYNYNDWHAIFGNFTKFGLGVASIAFDIIFIVQHYILYPNRKTTSSLQSILIANENE